MQLFSANIRFSQSLENVTRLSLWQGGGVEVVDEGVEGIWGGLLDGRFEGT
jgi:hypothetical protein